MKTSNLLNIFLLVTLLFVSQITCQGKRHMPRFRFQSEEEIKNAELEKKEQEERQKAISEAIEKMNSKPYDDDDDNEEIDVEQLIKNIKQNKKGDAGKRKMGSLLGGMMNGNDAGSDQYKQAMMMQNAIIKQQMAQQAMLGQQQMNPMFAGMGSGMGGMMGGNAGLFGGGAATGLMNAQSGLFGANAGLMGGAYGMNNLGMMGMQLGSTNPYGISNYKNMKKMLTSNKMGGAGANMLMGGQFGSMY